MDDVMVAAYEVVCGGSNTTEVGDVPLNIWPSLRSLLLPVTILSLERGITPYY